MHDGQPSLWEKTDNYHQGWERIDILDLLHVIPRIWDAGKILHPEALETFVKERLTMILLGGVGIVISGIKRMASMHSLCQRSAETLNDNQVLGCQSSANEVRRVSRCRLAHRHWFH